MSDSPDNFSQGLISLEGGEGQPVDLPPDMTMPKDGAPPAPAAPDQEPTAPPADVPPLEPAEFTDEQIAEQIDRIEKGDPRFAGVLRDLQGKRRENASLKEAAAAGAQLANLLASRPDVLYALQHGQPFAAPHPTPAETAPPAPTVDPQEEAELRQVAEMIGLYNAEGAPDLDKARTFLSIQERRAERTAGNAVKPLQQTLNQQANERAYHEAVRAARELGIDDSDTQRVLNTLWSEDGGSGLRNPDVVATALLVTAGASAARARLSTPKAPPAPPSAPPDADLPVLRQPMATPPPDRSTGLPAGPPPVPEIVVDTLKGRGFTAKDANRTMERLSQHRPGQMFILED